MVVGDDGLYRNLQEFMHRSSIGQDTALSRREDQFDSGTVCQSNGIGNTIQVWLVWYVAMTMVVGDDGILQEPSLF